VSFDQNNVVGGVTNNGTYYVSGGVPISFPAKDAPFEKFDYGMVVFSADATNFLGETIEDRWSGSVLIPVHGSRYGVSVKLGQPCGTQRLDFHRCWLWNR
jgi:hypothetical protein